METPLEISFRNMKHSDAIEASVRERVDRLEKFHPHIISCRVMVEAPEHRHRKGRLFHCRIEIGVPGKDVIVSRHPQDNHAHEDIHVAIRDAFEAARRQLDDHSRKMTGKVKFHEGKPQGRIVRIFPEQGYGFIETSDGQEVYFHQNSVLNDQFGKLDVGHEVRLVIAEGESPHGFQASTVEPA